MDKPLYRVECKWIDSSETEHFDFATLKSAELQFDVCMTNKDNAAYIRIIDMSDDKHNIIKEFFN